MLPVERQRSLGQFANASKPISSTLAGILTSLMFVDANA